MTTRVTFRIADDLADTLRELPNQTRFVERALREALGRTCPTCDGAGRIPKRPLVVSNVRQLGVKRLARDEATRLQRIYRMGQQVAATRIDLAKSGRTVTFRMMRGGAELINGTLSRAN